MAEEGWAGQRGLACFRRRASSQEAPKGPGTATCVEQTRPEPDWRNCLPGNLFQNGTIRTVYVTSVPFSGAVPSLQGSTTLAEQLGMGMASSSPAPFPLQVTGLRQH